MTAMIGPPARLPSVPVVGLLVAATGCMPALHNRVSGNAIVRPRLVAMPPQLLLRKLDAEDNTSNEHPSSNVRLDAEGALRAIIKENGVHFAEPGEFAACGLPCDTLRHWGTVATQEIGLQREGIRDYGSHSVADWRFGSDLSAVRKSLDADFALFVTLKQTRETTGRKVVMALAHSYTTGLQINAACVADLHDGRMVWCSSTTDRFDVEEPGNVLQLMRTLMRDLFPPPPSASPPQSSGDLQ